jgi:hypothetical protein
MGISSLKRKGKHTREADFVLTPGGWRPKSKAFKVEPGHHVEVQDGRLKVIHTATGTVVADLGEVPETSVENSKKASSAAGSSGKIRKLAKRKK